MEAMKFPERIVAATDLSAPSRHATDRACMLAASSAAPLSLLHVLPKSALDQLRQLIEPDALDCAQKVADEAAQKLAQLAAESGRKHGVDASVHLTEGAVPQTISAFAEKDGGGLLVISARGEGFLRHMLLGSTASRVMRQTSVPMLVVKQSPHEAYRRLLVTVDFSPLSSSVLEHARALAPSAEIVLHHSYEVPFEGKLLYAGVEEDVVQRYRTQARKDAQRKLEEFADAHGLAARDGLLAVRYGDPTQQILQLEQEYDCDLIVMGKHGSELEDFLLGSVTKHVLTESQGDVLVVSPRGQR